MNDRARAVDDDTQSFHDGPCDMLGVDPHFVLVADLSELGSDSIGVSRAATKDEKVVDVDGDNREATTDPRGDVPLSEMLAGCSVKGLVSSKDDTLLAKVGGPRPSHAHGIDAEPHKRVGVDINEILSSVAPRLLDVKISCANAFQGKPRSKHTHTELIVGITDICVGKGKLELCH